MVEQRLLSARKDEIYSFGAEEAWESLLSSEILVSVTTTAQRVAFSHNILFDYAVSVSLLEDEPSQFIDFLLKDPSRPLFLRPSLQYYFTRLWHGAPDLFWRIFWKILPSSDIYLRMFTRLLPTSVIVNEVRKLDQLTPILNALKQSNPIADESILRLLQALRVLRNERIEQNKLWAQFLEKASEHVHKKWAWNLAVVTFDILEQAEKQNDLDVIEICGTIGRHLLTWIWEQRKVKVDAWINQLGSSWVVPLVARTFGTDPKVSRQLLVRVLDLVKEQYFPINFIYRLAEEIDKILPYDSEFVASVYLTVFGYYESSEEKTGLGSPVLPLSSTRRQDYEMCQFVLVKKFPQFIQNSPILATQVAIGFLNSYVIGRHIIGYLEDGVKLDDMFEEFQFRDKNAYYLQDASYIWDETHYIERPLEMAVELFEFVAELTETGTNSVLIGSIFDIFRDEAYVAFIWKHLLEIGAQHPKAFVPYLYELCLARPIQTGTDTIYELGKFLEAASPNFNEHQLMKIEESIISLPKNNEDDERKKSLVHCRDRLLACIPDSLLKTEEAQKIRLKMKKAKKVPPNEPLVRFETKTEPYTEEKFLSDQGADLTSLANKELQEFYKPLEKFTSNWFNKMPDFKSIKTILPFAQNLYNVLQKITSAHDAVINATWTHLAACAETITRGISEADNEEFLFCHKVLLICADKDQPRPSPEVDSQYNSPFWVPAPRSYAAIGLPKLADIKPDNSILKTIENLTHDKVPSIRYLIMLELHKLHNHAAATFWKLSRDRAENETNRIVRDALCRSLGRVISTDEKQATYLLNILVAKELSTKEEIKFMSDCLASLVVWLIIMRENEWAIKTTEALLEDPIRFTNPLNRLTFYVLDYINPNRLRSDEKPKDIDTAIKWLHKLVDSATKGTQDLIRIQKEQWDEKTGEKLRGIYDIIDKIVSRIYIDADVRDELRGNREKALSEEQRKMFYFTVKPILEKVLTFTTDEKTGLLFASTAHHFMEFLNGVLKYDPTSILRMATNVAKSSEPFGYNLDSLAVREVVNLVETILADYRSEVREGKSLEDLLTLLDIFANTGWPEALRLVWRLDEIFR